MITVFAKNLDNDSQIECFILDLTTPGVSRSKIEYKMSLRAVQNMQFYFQNVKIPAKNRLPGVNGFASVARCLAESRLIVAWNAAGVGLGIYDNMFKYVNERKQFGKKLTSYQLIQDKLVRVMGIVQASLLMAWNAERRMELGQETFGQLAMVKGWVTKNMRYFLDSSY